jgi:integrase
MPSCATIDEPPGRRRSSPTATKSRATVSEPGVHPVARIRASNCEMAPRMSTTSARIAHEERDRLCAYFAAKNRHYYPLVLTMFWTGLRTGEAVGLRRGDLDLHHDQLHIRRSRTMREDNLPKTKRSRRTVTLVPAVAAALRAMPAPLHVTDDAFVFTTMVGTPLDAERFVEKHWHRALRATGIRPRKFYATRHTFISQALSTPGISLKWLADYCGTSVDMIERHYGRYMHGDTGQLALLAGSSP